MYLIMYFAGSLFVEAVGLLQNISQLSDLPL